MKTQKRHFGIGSMVGVLTVLAASSLSVGFSPLALASEGGSGTTGGGDYELNIENVIPKTLRIYKKAKFPLYLKAVAVGKKRGWGFFPMTDYARTVEQTVEFNRDKMIRGEDGFETKTIAIGKRNRLQVADHLMYGDIIAYDIEWDGQRLSEDEFLSRLFKMFELVSLSINVERFETIKAALKTKPFFVHFLISVEREINDVFWSTLQGQANDLLALGKTVIASGKCDPDKFALLMHRLRNWKLGTSDYFDEVRLATGYELGARDSARTLRLTVRGTVADEVEPICRNSLRPVDLTDEDLGR